MKLVFKVGILAIFIKSDDAKTGLSWFKIISGDEPGEISTWVVQVGVAYTKFMFFLHIQVWIYWIHTSKVDNTD